MSRNSIVTSALILTAAGVITRILGFVYRIYMSNAIGAEGMGLYQMIMPVYGLAWSIACSGFTTTVSKLTAQERAKGEYGNMGRILKQSVCITTLIGILLSFILFFCAPVAAAYFFKDMRTMLSLQILSLALPFMAAGTCVRSYFIGLQETLVPAVNQVLEQCVRMVVIFFLAGFLIPRGLEYACAAAVIGIVCEEVFSLVYIVLSYRKFKNARHFVKPPSMSSSQSLALILSMALPLTGNRVTGSLLATLENILIPQRLQMFGMTSSEAISAFGRISGMAMPLIFFPSALLQALSTALVPAVSESIAKNDYAGIRRTLSKSVVFASVIGMGTACVFVTFPHELGQAIYRQEIGEMLMLLGIMCPFMYIQIVFSGALNGLGCQAFIFRNSLLSSLINIVFIYFLVPVKGINAFILGWFVSLIIICALEIEKIRKSVDMDIEYINWFVKPCLSALATGLSVERLADKFIFPVLGGWKGLFASLFLLVTLYVFFIIATGCLSMSDLQHVLPGVLKRKKKRI